MKLYLGLLLGLLILFGVQYVLCLKVKKFWVRLLPWLYVAGSVVMGLLYKSVGSNGGLLNMNGVVGTFWYIYGVLAAAVLIAAWVLSVKRRRKAKEEIEDAVEDAREE